jgi:hypothetical protein
MARFRWWIPPVIVAPIEVSDGSLDEFLRFDIIERSQFNGNKRTSQCFDMTLTKRANATVFAK